MNLRWLVLGLLAANALFWAWSQGWFGSPGSGPLAQREPHRLQQQIRPDTVRVLPPGLGMPAPAPTPATGPPAPSTVPVTSAPPAAMPVTAAPAATTRAAAAAASALAGSACLETEPLPPASLESAEQALAGVLPGRSWIRATREASPLYAVVIGPLSGTDALQKKREELGRIRVGGEEIRLPAGGGPTLALGRYDSRDSAQAGLDSFSQRGVKTARVVTLREPVVETRLRIENLSVEQADALRLLKAPALGPQGLLTCGSSR